MPNYSKKDETHKESTQNIDKVSSDRNNRDKEENNLKICQKLENILNL